MTEVFVVLIVILTLFAGWWLLIETEGVYLGRRVVIWLYDFYAQRYDRIKEFHPEYEHLLIARPLMSRIVPEKSPMVLDVATGSGRLPLALLDHAYFSGRIIGVDLSRGMLAVAAEKIAEDANQVDLIWCPAEHLPFPDAAFDVVTCLESLEFMRDQRVVLAELARVLRPGGLLLTTSRINTRWMPGRTFDDGAFVDLLAECGFEDVEIEPWQEDYHRVWAVRAGESAPVGSRALVDVLRCPICDGEFSTDADGVWSCADCDGRIQTGVDGVVEIFPLYRTHTEGQDR